MKFFGLHADFLGFSASFLCAVHCMLLPVVVAVGSFSGLAWLADPIVEIVMILFATVIACVVLLKTYIQVHRNILPLLISVAGFLLIALSHSVFDENHAVMAIGGFLIAAAHYYNWKITGCRNIPAPTH